MNPLIDKLNELVASGTPVGFCPYDDGDGMFWGRILEVTETTFRVQQLDVYGKNEDVEEYELTLATYFDEDPIYAQRLTLLANFSPTMPEETNVYSHLKDTFEFLREARATGEVVRISFTGTEELDGTITEFSDSWFSITYYNDIMKSKGTQWVRFGQLKSLTWRNARCEADGYLLKRQAK